ncbi:uncharacterized protein [Dendrobates tinctorius]|uniref:uncharacterized protein n=1 Tax=Dendrobates tinctorius TaxID=92724 RepID=UPI003CC94806
MDKSTVVSSSLSGSPVSCTFLAAPWVIDLSVVLFCQESLSLLYLCFSELLLALRDALNFDVVNPDKSEQRSSEKDRKENEFTDGFSAFKVIVNEKPKFPSWLDADVKHLIKKLLRKLPQIRLGAYGNIREHPFFTNIGWEDLEERRAEPPFTPFRPVLENQHLQGLEQKFLHSVVRFTYVSPSWAAAGDNHREHTGFISQACKLLDEITTLEKNINFLQKKIEKRTIELENLEVTQPRKPKIMRRFRRFSLRQASKKAEFTKNLIEKMKENKKSYENTLEEKNQELEAMDDILRWLYKIKTTPSAFRPYKYPKCIWCPSLKTIREETAEQIMEEEGTVNDNIAVREETIENKAKKTTTKSRHQFIVSLFSCFKI